MAPRNMGEKEKKQIGECSQLDHDRHATCIVSVIIIMSHTTVLQGQLRHRIHVHNANLHSACVHYGCALLSRPLGLDYMFFFIVCVAAS